MRHDTRRRFKFAALQSPAGRTLANRAGVPEASSAGASLALLSGDSWLRESDAALEIVSQLRWPLSILGYLRVLPSDLRDGVYRLVARNRRRSPTGCVAGHELDARTVPGGIADGDRPAV